MNEQQKIQWLFDIESIKQLKARYCAFCDEGYNPDGIAALMTDDCVWDGGIFGRYEGKAAIHEFFSGAASLISFANHYVSNPVIDVDGDTATGRWDLWQPMVAEPAHEAQWLVAKYRDRYVRVDGQWLFSEVNVMVKALSPYADGFAKTLIVGN